MVAVSLKKKKKKKKKKKNIIFFFFKQKTAYEMCDSDWSSDVCSSDLGARVVRPREVPGFEERAQKNPQLTLRVRACEQIGRASCRERVYTKV